jgi:hypothetical protein
LPEKGIRGIKGSKEILRVILKDPFKKFRPWACRRKGFPIKSPSGFDCFGSKKNDYAENSCKDSEKEKDSASPTLPLDN